MRIAVVASMTLLCLVLRGEESPKEAKPEVNDARFHARLLEIAAKYESLGRVDDEFRWAPWMCRMPRISVARFSNSDDSATHGQKLFFLFAAQKTDYLALNSSPSQKESDIDRDKKIVAEGQVVVKESWKPKEVAERQKSGVISRQFKYTEAERKALLTQSPFRIEHEYGFDSFDLHAKKQGKLYIADKKHALFIMYKTASDAPGTDAGWVYGTVTADGKTVTSAGRVASCMQCHEAAPHERLFGLQKDKRQED